MANKEELLARLQEEKPAMEVRDLSFAYGSNQILKDISLMIKEGKIKRSWEPMDVENQHCFL